MCALDTAGGLSTYSGRPLGTIKIPPSYLMTFFNTTLESPLTSLGFESPSLNASFDEGLGDTNVKYERVLHMYTNDEATGRPLYGPYYVPYIDEVEVAGEETVYHTLPLLEVNNPRFVETSNGMFLMYFFTNFTTADLPDGQYTSDSKYLRRVVEFATNNPDEVPLGGSPSDTTPLPNNINYWDDDEEVDSTPRIAFLSALMRVFPTEVDGSQRMFVMFDKPQILTWVGHRFGLDYHPPVLVNRVQKVEWAASKVLSDSLDPDAVNDDPPREVPYHHVVSGIEGVMYPGYGGLNFHTKPIHDVYDVALDHLFQTKDGYEKTFDWLEHRAISSIGIKQVDAETLSFGGITCTGLQGSSETSPVAISSSTLDPAKKHFVVFQISMDDFRPYSSSSASLGNSYSVEIPWELNPRGDDKPDFWPDYWVECGDPASSSVSLGSIDVDPSGENIWYGMDCISGVFLFAQLELRPFDQFNGELLKNWLTIGIASAIFNVELDLLWQGYLINSPDAEPKGTFTRYWSIADDSPSTITVT